MRGSCLGSLGLHRSPDTAWCYLGPSLWGCSSSLLRSPRPSALPAGQWETRGWGLVLPRRLLMVLAFLYIPLGDALIPTTLPEVRTPKVQVHPVPRTQLVWKVRAWGVGHEPRTAPRGQAGSDGGLGPAPRPILPLWLGSQGFWAGLAGSWGQGRSTCSVHQNHQGWPCPGSHPSPHRIATGSTRRCRTRSAGGPQGPCS